MSAPRNARRHGGFGLTEVLVALALFSTVFAGLAAAQLAAKRAAFESAQRDLALGLASDLIARVRANPGGRDSYRLDAAGDPASPLPRPASLCVGASCNPVELAAFDLWRWESRLLGVAERRDSLATGGLVAARACLDIAASVARVALSWRGASPALEPGESACGAAVTGLYDVPGEPPGNNRLRRQLVLSVYLGDAP